VVVAALDVVETCVGAVFEKANTSNTAAPCGWTAEQRRLSDPPNLFSSLAGRSSGETGTNDKQARPLVLRPGGGGEPQGLVRNSTYLMP
jgi:hypothetical protein